MLKMLSLLLFASLAKAECPQNSPELMRFFGWSLTKATMLSRTVNPETVDQNELQAAIAGIDSAAVCAERAAEPACSELLIPERLRSKGDAYRALMLEFAQRLREYSELFRTLKFDQLAAKKEEI